MLPEKLSSHLSPATQVTNLPTFNVSLSLELPSSLLETLSEKVSELNHQCLEVSIHPEQQVLQRLRPPWTFACVFVLCEPV